MAGAGQIGMQERVGQHQLGGQRLPGVLQVHGRSDSEVGSRARSAEAQSARRHAEFAGMGGCPQPCREGILMGHRKMHAVPGQPVVHGEHHAAGPVHELPGHLVSLAHVEVAAGKASAVQPDQAGHTAVGQTAVEPCRAGGPHRHRAVARTGTGP